MRIENTIHEIQGPKSSDRRIAEVRRRRGSEGSGDRVEISSAARNLGSAGVSKSALNSVADVRQERVQEVRERVASGFYDRPEVQRAIADAVLESGVVNSVGREASTARELKSGMDHVPEVRAERVEAARQRVTADFYSSADAKA
jgi:anti-sigma28 factor (negative regulator of flagellin synthesis)